MKQKLTILAAVFCAFFIIACGSKKESAASVAQKWCELNGKAYKAEGEAKAAAEMAREKFEKEIEEKYKDNKDFMKEVEAEVEKCEGASEGR